MNRRTIKIFIWCTGMFCTNGVFASCSTGFSELTYLSGSAFMAPSNGVCDAPGYKLTTIPDDFELFYSGLVIGSEVTLCGDKYLSNGECVSYARGDCATGNYTVNTGVAFMAPTGNTCDAPGYKIKTISDDFYGIYTGTIIGSEVTLCTNGYMSGGTCVQYAQGACINGYYDLALNDATFSIPANNTCSSPYTTASSVNVCSETPGTVCALSRHECTSGNYLPMSATSCTACPNGYTCAGGTYTYSENIDQGKVGNTITVIWHDALQSDIDANGAGTIIYGGDINTPVRVDPSAIPPGKRFTGWRFSKPNN